MTILSCKSVSKKDLLALKLDADLSSLVQEDKQLKKDQDPNLGLVGYRTSEIDEYAIGEIKLKTYAYPNGNLADYNSLIIFVNAKDNTNYLGFNYSTVNQDEAKSILNYLKNTYPTYQQSATNGNGESFIWDIPKLNSWIFSYQGISTDKNKHDFFTTNFIYIKKGTRMENSADSKVITIKDYYKMMYPDLVK